LKEFLKSLKKKLKEMLNLAKKLNENGYVAGTKRSDYAIYSSLSLDGLVRSPCKKVRKSPPCPNKAECRNCFGNLSEFAEVVKEFRDLIWKDEKKNRGVKLRDLLETMSTRRPDGNVTINYNIKGMPVCKDFFRAATGFRRQCVDEMIAIAEGRLEVGKRSSLAGIDRLRDAASMTRVQSTVLAFLSEFYTKNRVEYDPGTGNLLTIKSSMKAAYNDDYIPFCESASVSPVAYSTFTSIRKNHFPRLKKHKSCMRKNGLNHFLIFNSYSYFCLPRI
jgi:hypothetical protein